MKKHLFANNVGEKYNYDRPPTRGPVVAITKYADVQAVMNNPSFAAPYVINGQAVLPGFGCVAISSLDMSNLLKGSLRRYLATFNRPDLNMKDTNTIRQAFLAGATPRKHIEFFGKVIYDSSGAALPTTDIQRSNRLDDCSTHHAEVLYSPWNQRNQGQYRQGRHQPSPSSLYLDIRCTLTFISQSPPPKRVSQIGLPLKTAAKPVGSYYEQELQEKLWTIYDYIFISDSPFINDQANNVRLRDSAKAHAAEFRDHVLRHFDTVGGSMVCCIKYSFRKSLNMVPVCCSRSHRSHHEVPVGPADRRSGLAQTPSD